MGEGGGNETTTIDQRVLQLVPEPAMVVDEDYRIVEANEALAALAGITADEVVGRHCYEVAHGREQVCDGEHGDCPYERAFEDGESDRVIHQHVGADGDLIDVEVATTPLTDGSGDVVRMVEVLRDVSRRRRTERENDLFRTLVDSAWDELYVIDPDDGVILDANETACERLGYACDDLVGRPVHDVVSGFADAEAWDRHIAQVGDQDRFEVETRHQRADGTTYPVEVTVSHVSIDGRTHQIAIAREISDWLERERLLSTLNDLGRELQDAKTIESVGERVVSGARELFDLAGVAVYRYDRGANRLVRIAAAGDADATPVVTTDDETVWSSFVAGETRTHECGERSAFERAHTELLEPTGTRGLLAVAADRDFDEDEREAAEMLAKFAAASVERLEREQELRDRERDLEQSNRRLNRLLERNERIRTLSHDVVRAGSREEVARTACEGLVGIDEVAYAWVGRLDSATGELDPLADAGADEGYLSEATLGIDADRAEPSLIAVETGQPVSAVTNDDQMRSAAWRQAALRRDFLSVLSVPTRDAGGFSGVLSVYATTPGFFDTEVRELFEDLVDTISVAFNSVQRRHSLLTDERIDLTYVIPDDGCLFATIAREQHCSCRLGGVVDRPDGSMLLHVFASCGDPAGTVNCARDHPHVREVTVLEASDDGTHLEVHASENFVAGTVADAGGRVVALRTEGTDALLSVDLPRDADVRAFTERVRERYPDARLQSRQDSVRSQSTADTHAALTRMLTERQSDTLRAAHERGFFEWPRETTGEQLADEFGVAPATFHRHLRIALKKVLDEALED
jgi:PAS domain S-box-containing protein